MNAPVINLQSDSWYIRLEWLERMKLIPPFNAAAKVSRTNAPPTQAEHLPFLGSYFISESGGPDGNENHAEPRFSVTLKCGFSWVIQNNDPEQAEDLLDQASWAFMKMLHDPNWQQFTVISGRQLLKLESIPGYELTRHYGNLSHTNETPIAEMRLEVEFFWRNYFEALVSDPFEIFHSTTLARPDTDPEEVRPIITIINLPQ